jgi:hypothetical protein
MIVRFDDLAFDSLAAAIRRNEYFACRVHLNKILVDVTGDTDLAQGIAAYRACGHPVGPAVATFLETIDEALYQFCGNVTADRYKPELIEQGATTAAALAVAIREAQGISTL